MPDRPKNKRKHVDDLRGASKLAIQATKSVTELVEAMHRNIASGPDLLGSPLKGPARVLTGLVYGSIRGVTHLVGASIDGALAQLAPLLGESAPGPERDAVLAVLNGVLGDYLQETDNPLAIKMSLRHDTAQTGKRWLVMVHGSSMNERQWSRRGHDHGKVLSNELGMSPVYVRYNSGLHISTNGAQLSELLERLFVEWSEPVEDIVIIAHSMGGLVSRAACHVAEESNHTWRRKLRKLICIGSPHHGAPLERGGNWVDLLLGISKYSAPLAKLGQIRSAGVTDMRYGNVLDEHWEGRDRFAHGKDHRTPLPLPDGVECYAIAGTTTTDAKKKLQGDGLVPVTSALGKHDKPELTLAFPPEHQWIAIGTGHLDLLDAQPVYDKLQSWCRG